jgi:antitoxin (DNA-binding transcriptional repressor) of toxin-antitoxin stability system
MDPVQMTLRETRDQLGRRVDAAHYGSEITIITKNGEERAALVPVDIARQYIEQQGRPA